MDITSIILLVFSLLLAHSVSCSSVERCNISDDVPAQDNVCLIHSYKNTTGLSDSVISSEDIEFLLRDHTNGVLEVKFPILKKYFTYELRLYVMEEALSEEECNTFKDLKDYSLHSTRLFDILSCKDDLNEEECDAAPTCTKFTTVTFSHVFGGCYLLHITPKYNSSSGEPTNFHKMINSKHKKSLIWNMKPSVADQSYPDELRLRISNFTMLFSTGLKVRFWLIDGCDDSSAHQHQWVLGLTNNSAQLQCETIKDGIYHPVCEVINNHTKSINSITCTFYNMTPGQYCVILEPIERDRCNLGTVWTPGLKTISPCKYQHIFTFRKKSYLNQPSVTLPTNPNSNALIAVGSIGALAAFVILGVAMYSSLHYSFHGVSPVNLPPLDATESNNPKVNSKSHILLLYAQDCQPFMKLMGTLRALLANYGKCEVLDCFDPACAEFVAPAPEEWMVHVASIYRVVLVVSDCGVELQNKKMMAPCYKYPLPYCHLFLLGLQQITSALSSSEYCRVFVVRFDGKDLNFITPHIRFSLPHNLCDLLRHINPTCDIQNLKVCEDDQKLKNDIEEFLHYKNENPNYVTNLLFVEESI